MGAVGGGGVLGEMTSVNICLKWELNRRSITVPVGRNGLFNGCNADSSLLSLGFSPSLLKTDV